MPGEILNLKENVGEFLVKRPEMIGAYETMIFKDGEPIGYQVRYETEDEARKGHQEAIEFIKNNKTS